MKRKSHFLFAYGTLRPYKHATHRLDNHAMYDYGKFPYIVHSIGSVVHGNVVKVTESQLKELDKYEGVDRGLYTREKVEASDYQGNRFECFVYVATRNIHPQLVTSGDWFNR